MSVRRILDLGATVISDPRDADGALPARPGHVLIPELRYGAPDKDWEIELAEALAKSVERLEGPFDPPSR